MHTLTDREKRTVSMAGAGLAIYLLLFFGVRGGKQLEARRVDYQKLVREAQRLKLELEPYENRALLLEKLKETYRIDPLKLSKAKLVAEASAAIQKAALSGGIQLGPIRESAARPSARELTSMQLESSGPVPALMTFLHRLQTLGYPILLDSMQVSSDPAKPGLIKLSLTIVILDFDQWKTEDVRNV